MKHLILAMAMLGLTSPALAVSDFDGLIERARAHHARMHDEVGSVRMTIVGTFTAPGAEGSGMEVTMWRKGSRWRTEGTMRAPGGTGGKASVETITLFDGTDLWAVTMGMKMKVPGGRSDNAGVSYWNEPPAGSKLVGSETVASRDCWIVDYPEAPKNPVVETGRTRVWIDKGSYVFVRSESELSGKTVRTSFSDFRKMKGFEIPHRITVSSDGKTTMTARITELEPGVAVSDDLFDPEALAGSEMGGPGGMDVEALMKQAEEMKKRLEAQTSDER